MIAKLESFDIQLFLLPNSIHNELGDTIMYWISDKYTWIPLYVFLIVIIGIKLGWKKLLIILPIVAVLIFATDQISVLIKELVQRHRPCYNADIAEIVHTVKDYCGGWYGFVSSHAANTFGLAVFVGCLFTRRVLFFILVWAFIV